MKTHFYPPEFKIGQVEVSKRYEYAYGILEEEHDIGHTLKFPIQKQISKKRKWKFVDIRTAR